MDYFSAFDISASGMAVQKVRLDTVALNLANVNTTRGANGAAFQPLEVIIGEGRGFQALYSDSVSGMQQRYGGARVVAVQPDLSEPRLVHDPAHPDADAEGFVAYPNINPVSEMVDLLQTTRAYEANVQALNAAKTMALRALEIGE
ncbi:flagellar basal body rod protein FlgC [Exilibacterium tricleocarpae]|uniref:Flagellar basal-body rod protein FlgC n=1 Tax=Exilibacterium tricleocarpae TaxID=2591008 RepID=A0A545T887_9GAMM|nr:flagellar basal body rod protein FlgC [Exilibacterium tricleocarpae]TQV73408.1 flagellar basal body rod protein FlgC [Exilibacterium tricleocarpae]